MATNPEALRLHERLALSAGKGELGDAAKARIAGAGKRAGKLALAALKSPVAAVQGVNAMRRLHETGQIMNAQNVELATALRHTSDLAAQRKADRRARWSAEGRAVLGVGDAVLKAVPFVTLAVGKGLGVLARLAERGLHHIANAGDEAGTTAMEMARETAGHFQAAQDHLDRADGIRAQHDARRRELHSPIAAADAATTGDLPQQEIRLLAAPDPHAVEQVIHYVDHADDVQLRRDIQ